ncbi:MAG: cation:proton antiporter [Bacteroidales bacterium]|nr:cation:proton antiporter [Bacteroidales bacterium]
MGSTFIILGLLIFSAHLFSAIFSKRRIPDVVLLVGIGIIVGPVLGIVHPEDLESIGGVFSSLTLLFILFDSGLDLSIDTIRRYWKGMVQVTLMSFVISMAGVICFSHYVLHIDWLSSVLAGSIVSGTAAAIVIPLVNQLKVSEKARMVLTLESAASGVLCIVVTIATLEISTVQNMSAMGITGMVFRVIGGILFALLLGIAGGILWAGLLDRVRKLQNSMFLTPAFVFVIYGIAEMLGYSGAIAALAFGIVLGNVEYFRMPLLGAVHLDRMQPLRLEEKSFFKEIVFILKTYFFVYVGISIPFTSPMDLLYGLMITGVLFVLRFLLLCVVGRENTRSERLVTTIMIPKGLVAAVLASMPERVNIEMGYTVIPYATTIKYMVYSVIFCSIIITSLLVFLTRKQLVENKDRQTTMNF